MPPLWKPATKPAGSHSGLEASGSHSFHSPGRRYYLRTINLEVGPFYSITVGSFYVVKATRDTKPSREVAIKTHTSLHAAFADGWEDFVVPELGAGFHV